MEGYLTCLRIAMYHPQNAPKITIINAGIKRVVCEKRYHADSDTIELFNQAGIKLDIKSQEVEKYRCQ